MKVLILGCGNIGSAAAEDMAKSMSSIEVAIADRNVERAKEAARKIGGDNVSWIQLDASNYGKLTKALKGFDLVMGFLPANLGYRLVKACIESGEDLVDVSYMPENPLKLNKEAVKKGVTVIPDCGLAPGISNILVGHAKGKFEKAQAVHIMVGGLPEKPVPPLGYTVTWSPESLIDEYTRKARIIRKGKIADVEALSGLEEVEFPDIGRLEAFFTDGLRTLLYTIGNVDEMWEKTLRYPGHVEKVQLLKALGFFDEKRIDVEGVRLSPRKLTVKLIEQKLWMPEIGDIVALRVEVSGVKDGQKARCIYHLLDRYDEKRQITAMARTTAYPASIIAQLMLREAIKDKGVIPPEKLGMNEELFRKFLDELEKREIKITAETVTG